MLHDDLKQCFQGGPQNLQLQESMTQLVFICLHSAATYLTVRTYFIFPVEILYVENLPQM